MIPFLIPAITQSVGALAKIGLGIKQNRLANKIKPVRTDYSVSPYAQNQLGIANQLFNSRMAGATQQEQNILASQGNMLSAVNRNATDSSSALAMAAASQGQADQSMANLGMAEGQNKLAMLGNLNQANQSMTEELDKVYRDKLDKYQEDMNAKAALRNAAWQNFGGAMSDIGEMGMQMGPLSFGGRSGAGRSLMPSTSAMRRANMTQFGSPTALGGFAAGSKLLG